MSVCHCVKTCCLQVYTSLYKTIYSVLEDLPRSVLIWGPLLLFVLLVIFIVHETSLPIKNKKGNPQLCCFVFIYSAFESVHLCAPMLYRSVCLYDAHTQTHTDTWEQLNKSKWMCSFHISCTLKLHGNHNIFNKLLQKNVLLIK